MRLTTSPSSRRLQAHLQRIPRLLDVCSRQKFTAMKSEYEKYASRAPDFQFRLPTQMRRLLPACAVVFFFLIFMSGSFGGIDSHYMKWHNTRFPRKIWQTWKIDPLGFEEKDLNLARSWVGKNPEFRYEVLTDKNDMAYVEREFGPDGLNRLDIVYTYRQLTAKIIKADLLRYLVMYVEGGVYTDIDVEALRPINRFVPERYEERDVDMVVGVEIDQPEFANHTILGQKCMSFCQWTFMCKPKQPVMLKLVENIMTWLKTVAMEQQVSIAEIKLDFDQVISGTGPSAFTNALLDEMSHRTGETVTWDRFHAIVETKLVGNILVLPVEAFAAGQGHSDSGTHDTKHSLVRHHYHASHWPDSHPRYKHPLVGQVEDCNWNRECVDKWDRTKAEFEALPKEEQQARLAQKEKDDEEKKQEDNARKEREEQEKKEREDFDRRMKEKHDKEDAQRREKAEQTRKEEEEKLRKELDDKVRAEKERADKANQGTFAKWLHGP